MRVETKNTKYAIDAAVRTHDDPYAIAMYLKRTPQSVETRGIDVPATGKIDDDLRRIARFRHFVFESSRVVYIDFGNDVKHMHAFNNAVDYEI